MKHEQDLDCGGGYIKLIPASRCGGGAPCAGGRAPPCMRPMQLSRLLPPRPRPLLATAPPTLRSGSAMESFGGETPYSIMFGPDICGYSTRKVHVILTKDGTNHLINKEIKAETDTLTHVYTLVIKPDNTYKVRVQARAGRGAALQRRGRPLLLRQQADVHQDPGT